MCNTTSLFIRADHLRLVGGWSVHARSIDDWWLMASCALLEPLLRVDEPSHLYRVHSGATSRENRFWLPYPSSLLALKYGGNHVDAEDAGETWPNQVAEHLYLRSLRASDVDNNHTAHFTRHAAELLWPDRNVSGEIRRMRLKKALPPSVVDGLRRLRRRAR